MKKIIIFLIIILAVIFAGAGILIWYSLAQKEPVICFQDAKLCLDGSYVGRSGPKCEFTACPRETAEMGEIKNLVEKFGKVLKNVSLLASKEVLIQSMEENYGEFIASDLLKIWKEHPSIAFGRMVSSPWPDRIEVETVQKITEERYAVTGKIIEATSAENSSGESILKRNFVLNVEKESGRWFVAEAALMEYEE